MQEYQMTFEDLQIQQIANNQPSRTAFIDECGSFGFDFSTDGASKYYILCAVIIEDKNLQDLHCKINEVKLQNGFSNTELKSSKIGSDDKRRSRIINQLLPIDFRVVLLIANKRKFIEGSPLRKNKKTFIKFLHQRLYELLYHVYPKLKIIEDEIGTSEFQESFKKYVSEQRPQYNLLNEYDFDYSDSKDDCLVQLADMIGGSINRSLIGSTSTNYHEMLKGKILATNEFPSKNSPYWGTVSPESCDFNSDIYALSVKCANDFISNNVNDDALEKRLQIAF